MSDERTIGTLNLDHEIIVTNWGHFTVLDHGVGFKLKILYVRPGAKMSMQKHRYRSEYWFVLSGKATIRYLNGKPRILEKSNFLYTPHMNWHQICNEEDEPLIIHEVQLGDCREEDVERKS